MSKFHMKVELEFKKKGDCGKKKIRKQSKYYKLNTIHYRKKAFSGLLFINKNKYNRLKLTLTLTDITPDILLAIEECEKRLKESVFSKIAHELKTPNIVLININNQVFEYIKSNQTNKAYDLCLYSINFS